MHSFKLGIDRWQADEILNDSEWNGMNACGNMCVCVVRYAVPHAHTQMIHLTDAKRKTTDNDAIQLLFNWLQVSFEMKRSFVMKCHSAITIFLPLFSFIHIYITNVKNALARPNNLHGIAIIFWMIWCILWNAYFATWIRLLGCNFLSVAVRKSEMEKQRQQKERKRKSHKHQHKYKQMQKKFERWWRNWNWK